MEDLINRSKNKYDIPLNTIVKEVYCEYLEILMKNCETSVKNLKVSIKKKGVRSFV
jgi:hypothetical protein